MAPTAESAQDLPASGAEPPLSNNASSPQLADDTTTLVGDSPPLKQNESMGDATSMCSCPRFGNSVLTLGQRENLALSPLRLPN